MVNGGIDMEANVEKLYSELRKTKSELESRLNNQLCSDEIQIYIKDELQDVNVAMGKITAGTYGTCEISGELIPIDVLKEIPTIKTIYEAQTLGHFFRKNINF